MMENVSDGNAGLTPAPGQLSSGALKYNIETEPRVFNNFKSIHSTPEGLVIKDEPEINEILELTGEYRNYKLKGTYDGGVQYYDLKNIHFINNNDIAHLIDLLKSLLKRGVEVQFVNVNRKIKKKIKMLGLDHVLICS